MAVTPVPSRAARHDPAEDRVWVLDDPRTGTATQALGIAERLGLPFRLVPLTWNWMAHLAGLSRHGSLLGVAGPAARPEVALEAPVAPALVISAGSRAAPVSLWLKARYGSRIVHCMRPGLGAVGRVPRYDLLVIPEHDTPPEAPNVLPVLGAPHRLSPWALQEAAAEWDDRLDYLPHPRVALLVGGPVRGTDMHLGRAHALGRRVARLATQLGGSVLATTSRRTGPEAADALAAGLHHAVHVIHRWGEPGPNPYRGFLALADAVVVTADSVTMLSEACATSAPVYAALPEQGGARHRRMLDSLRAAGQVRLLDRSLAPFPRTPLDEAGRVAAEIAARLGVS